METLLDVAVYPYLTFRGAVERKERAHGDDIRTRVALEDHP
jgi:hypothetical protein